MAWVWHSLSKPNQIEPLPVVTYNTSTNACIHSYVCENSVCILITWLWTNLHTCPCEFAAAMFSSSRASSERSTSFFSTISSSWNRNRSAKRQFNSAKEEHLVTHCCFFILRCRLFLSLWSKIRHLLDCSPTDRERDLGLHHCPTRYMSKRYFNVFD